MPAMPDDKPDITEQARSVQDAELDEFFADDGDDDSGGTGATGDANDGDSSASADAEGEESSTTDQGGEGEDTAASGEQTGDGESSADAAEALSATFGGRKITPEDLAKDPDLFRKITTRGEQSRYWQEKYEEMKRAEEAREAEKAKAETETRAAPGKQTGVPDLSEEEAAALMAQMSETYDDQIKQQVKVGLSSEDFHEFYPPESRRLQWLTHSAFIFRRELEELREFKRQLLGEVNSQMVQGTASERLSQAATAHGHDPSAVEFNDFLTFLTEDSGAGVLNSLKREVATTPINEIPNDVWEHVYNAFAQARGIKPAPGDAEVAKRDITAKLARGEGGGGGGGDVRSGRSEVDDFFDEFDRDARRHFGV